MPAVVITVRCHYCSHFRPPDEVMTIGDSIKMCFDCREKHLEEIIKFHPEKECAHCHRTFDALAALGMDVFTVHWMDRSYQILCRTCNAVYIPKRADLFRDTQFGWEQKI